MRQSGCPGAGLAEVVEHPIGEVREAKQIDLVGHLGLTRDLQLSDAAERVALRDGADPRIGRGRQALLMQLPAVDVGRAHPVADFDAVVVPGADVLDDRLDRLLCPASAAEAEIVLIAGVEEPGPQTGDGDARFAPAERGELSAHFVVAQQRYAEVGTIRLVTLHVPELAGRSCPMRRCEPVSALSGLCEADRRPLVETRIADFARSDPLPQQPAETANAADLRIEVPFTGLAVLQLSGDDQVHQFDGEVARLLVLDSHAGGDDVGPAEVLGVALNGLGEGVQLDEVRPGLGGASLGDADHGEQRQPGAGVELRVHRRRFDLRRQFVEPSEFRGGGDEFLRRRDEVAANFDSPRADGEGRLQLRGVDRIVVDGDGYGMRRRRCAVHADQRVRAAGEHPLTEEGVAFLDGKPDGVLIDVVRILSGVPFIHDRADGPGIGGAAIGIGRSGQVGQPFLRNSLRPVAAEDHVAGAGLGLGAIVEQSEESVVGIIEHVLVDDDRIDGEREHSGVARVRPGSIRQV